MAKQQPRPADGRDGYALGPDPSPDGMTEAGAVVADPVREVYDRTAPIYDRMTGADDYDLWVGLYRELIDRHGAPGRELVDLGCGTGKAALRLASSGFRVTGMDLSPEMIRMACAKPGAENVRFAVGDLRDLPEAGPFDVAVALGEPLNYLADQDELLTSFRSVAGVLRPGGLFVFDVNSAGFYRRLAEETSVEEEPGAVIVHRGSASPRQAEAADLRIDYFATADGLTWQRTSALHSFSYFAPDDVARLLNTAGLAQLAAYGLHRGALVPGGDEERDRKRLVVARKNAAALTR
ncbi:class I SAM-dependent methyltransferase [Nonomuraea sp. NPDC050404]|uniref:class I SAM-dependent DNA methyltransferase n=1 Tax=Nonomuraea sp. NPDC050404 TaxID=3155783 RepID=UPI0033EF15E0